MRCKAKSKRSGEQCKRDAMVGKEVCAIHGGKSLAGRASPSYKTGTHTRFLPARLQAAYESTLDDPQWLDLQRSVALLDARLVELLGKMDTGESGAVWRQLRIAHAQLRKAIDNGDAQGMIAALDEQGALIASGSRDYDVWNEMRGLLDERRRHVETQQRIETAGERGISAKELALFMGALMAMVNGVVTSPAEKNKIADGVDRLLAGHGRMTQ